MHCAEVQENATWNFVGPCPECVAAAVCSCVWANGVLTYCEAKREITLAEKADSTNSFDSFKPSGAVALQTPEALTVGAKAAAKRERLEKVAATQRAEKESKDLAERLQWGGGGDVLLAGGGDVLAGAAKPKRKVAKKKATGTESNSAAPAPAAGRVRVGRAKAVAAGTKTAAVAAVAVAASVQPPGSRERRCVCGGRATGGERAPIARGGDEAGGARREERAARCSARAAGWLSPRDGLWFVRELMLLDARARASQFCFDIHHGLCSSSAPAKTLAGSQNVRLGS